MLTNRVAFVTGAAKGIGKATALTLAGYGADVAVVDVLKDVERTADEIRALGRKSAGILMDVTRKEQVDSAVKVAVQQFKKIDILVNCAGIVTSSLLVDLDEETWDRIMNVNLKGVFLVTQAVTKEMIKAGYGKIVNFSSQASKIGEAGNGPYCASKAAINVLTQVLALELAAYNINVNAVCPGYTDTEIMQQVFQKRGPLEGMSPEEYEAKLLAGVPLKRMARPEEIGELVAFLSSDRAGYITGITVTIAGGKVLF
jgi:NAD(P)-dependent dehydrogenase (short-subunit alcohol dehydrogenase family)